jgi:hypothetical protein
LVIVALFWPSLSRALRRARGNGEINFYARVVDQNGNGLQGARVSIELDDVKAKDVGGFMVGSDASFMKKLVLTTDASGNFQVTGEFGAVLKLKAIDKEGLIVAERQGEKRGEFCFGMFRGRQYDNPDTANRRTTYVMVPAP